MVSLRTRLRGRAQAGHPIEQLETLPPIQIPSVGGKSHPAAVSLVGAGLRLGRRNVLEDINLAVWPGEVVYVVGPMEAGKTSLLRLVHGDLKPSWGRVSVAGVAVGPWSRRRRLLRIRKRVGAVYERHHLIEEMTALENVAFAIQVNNLWVPGSAARMRARERLAQVGLARVGNRLPGQLSGGQRARLALARALAPQPAVLVADDPAASLDAGAADEVFELLEAQARHRIAVLIATHNPRPFREGAQIFRLDAGRALGRSAHS